MSMLKPFTAEPGQVLGTFYVYAANQFDSGGGCHIRVVVAVLHRYNDACAMADSLNEVTTAWLDSRS